MWEHPGCCPFDTFFNHMRILYSNYLNANGRRGEFTKMEDNFIKAEIGN